MTIDETRVAALLARAKPSECPVLPVPDAATIAAMLRRPGGEQEVINLLVKRERLIRQAAQSPLEHGFTLDFWHRATRFIRHEPHRGTPTDPQDPEWERRCRLLAILGGNRSSKSELAMRWVTRTLLEHPGTQIVVISQKQETSKMVQQKMVWRALPAAVRALNKRRDPVFYVHYSEATGFGNPPQIILPRPEGHTGDPSRVNFLTYTTDPAEYEGIKLGCEGRPGVIGWAADEDLPLKWLELFQWRSVTLDAMGLWTFTAIDGMTQALNELIGAGRVVESRPARLLGERDNVRGVPKGHMPTIQHGTRPDTAVVYFHSEENPFNNFDRLKAELAGRSVETIERRAYGYARAVKGKRFKNFGPWNVVPVERIPAGGTNYIHVDPAGARNWFVVLARATSDGRVYVLDEWPNHDEHGEWAVPTRRSPGEQSKGWDGDPGPAQETLGYGLAKYKTEVLAKMVARMKVEQAAQPAEGGEVQGFVARYTVDRRFGPSPVAGVVESTCLWEELCAAQTDAQGREVAPALDFELATGDALQEDGFKLIEDALDWDRERPLDAMRNAPRLYVAERCVNVIWALTNFTGKDGQKGACKDPVDCVRDLFTSRMEYVTAGMLGSRGGGSY